MSLEFASENCWRSVWYPIHRVNGGMIVLEAGCALLLGGTYSAECSVWGFIGSLLMIRPERSFCWAGAGGPVAPGSQFLRERAWERATMSTISPVSSSTIGPKVAGGLGVGAEGTFWALWRGRSAAL